MTQSAPRTSRRKSPTQVHRESFTFGQRAADAVAGVVGSWTFIITLSIALAIWITLNVVAWIRHWDPYPFILLNLMLSFLAAYQAPMILMSQNRMSEHDRIKAEQDFEVNVRAEHEIEDMQQDLANIERKLDELLARSAEPAPGGRPRE